MRPGFRPLPIVDNTQLRPAFDRGQFANPTEEVLTAHDALDALSFQHILEMAEYHQILSGIDALHETHQCTSFRELYQARTAILSLSITYPKSPVKQVLICKDHLLGHHLLLQRRHQPLHFPFQNPQCCFHPRELSLAPDLLQAMRSLRNPISPKNIR